MNKIRAEAHARGDVLISEDLVRSAVNAAVVAESRGDWPTAEAQWRRALEREPANPQHPLSLANVLRKLGHTEDAEAVLTSASGAFPKEAAIWSALGALAEQKADWVKAGQCWRRYLEFDSRNPQPYVSLARALRIQRQFDAADAVLAAVQDRFSDDRPLLVELARIAQDRRDWTGAAVRWQAVLDRFPDVWDGYGGLIAVLLETGHQAEADAALKMAAAKFGDHPSALTTLAQTADSRRDWAAAEDYWRRLIAVAPHLGWAHVGLARALQELDRPDAAAEVRRAALERLPGDLSILSDIARQAERRGDWTAALAGWNEIHSVFPKLMAGYIGQATALIELGRFEEGRVLLEGATRQFPGDMEPVHHLEHLKRRQASGSPDDAVVGEAGPFDAIVRGHSGKGYLTPTTLRVTEQAPLRIALVGSCQLDGWGLQRFAPEGSHFEVVTVNNMAALPDLPAKDIQALDFMVVQVPTRAILWDGALWQLDYDDIDGFQAVFEKCCDRIDQRLDLWMKWNAEHGLLTFVSGFLVPQDGGMGRLFPRYDLRNTQYFFERLNEHLERSVRAYKNAYLFDLDRVVTSLGKRTVQDDAVEFISHGSFMPMPGPDDSRMEPMAGLGSHYEIDWFETVGPPIWAELLAMYRTVRQIDPVKLVVVDLDDTMWKGISGDMAELDASEMLGFWPMGFAESLTWLKKRGILLAILSKNEEQRIREIFPKIYGAKLPLSEFAAVMVNWRPKAESMAQILETMNLLPRNVVFIDDNPVERAAMQAAFPAMRVIGRYPYYLRRLMLWSAETQVASVTTESGKRTQMMQRQFEREGKRKELSRDDFLRDAAPQVTLMEIGSTDHPRFARVLELTNKTNQFNTTGRRWKLEEMQALLNEGGRIVAFDVTDNFTAYGLVGVVLVKGNAIVQWVMSCRVLGYQIEQAVMASIAAQFTPSASDPIRGTLIETDVNFPCRTLFSSCGFVQDGTEWRLPENTEIAIPGHVTMHAGNG